MSKKIKLILVIAASLALACDDEGKSNADPKDEAAEADAMASFAAMFERAPVRVTPCKAVEHYPPTNPFPYDALKEGNWTEYDYDKQGRITEQRFFNHRTGRQISKVAWTHFPEYVEARVMGRQVDFMQQLVRNGDLLIPGHIEQTGGPAAGVLHPDYDVDANGHVIRSHDVRDRNCTYEYADPNALPFAIIFGQTLTSCQSGRNFIYEYDSDGRIVKQKFMVPPPGNPRGADRVFFKYIDFEYECG